MSNPSNVNPPTGFDKAIKIGTLAFVAVTFFLSVWNSCENYSIRKEKKLIQKIDSRGTKLQPLYNFCSSFARYSATAESFASHFTGKPPARTATDLPGLGNAQTQCDQSINEFGNSLKIMFSNEPTLEAAFKDFEKNAYAVEASGFGPNYRDQIDQKFGTELNASATKLMVEIDRACARE